MLSELLFASVPTSREAKPDRVPGITGSQLFPCPYRLYKVHTGEPFREEFTPQQILNLEDGWSQEENTVKLLKERAGIVIFNRQKRVLIGKSKIPGTIDGEVRLNDKVYLWEHKAWSTNAFADFVHSGIDKFPQQKAQTNAYTLADGLDEYIFHVKCKETNDYKDVVYPIDHAFIDPIIEWANRIRIDGWVPKPELCKWCAYCGYDCFGQVVDFSGIAQSSDEKMASTWREGKKLQGVGEMLLEESRDYFIGVKDKEGNVLRPGIIGDKDVLLVEGLKVLRIPTRRWSISRQSIVKEFGTEGFLKVAREELSESFRITDTEE